MEPEAAKSAEQDHYTFDDCLRNRCDQVHSHQCGAQLGEDLRKTKADIEKRIKVSTLPEGETEDQNPISVKVETGSGRKPHSGGGFPPPVFTIMEGSWAPLGMEGRVPTSGLYRNGGFVGSTQHLGSIC